MESLDVTALWKGAEILDGIDTQLGLSATVVLYSFVLYVSFVFLFALYLRNHFLVLSSEHDSSSWGFRSQYICILARKESLPFKTSLCILDLCGWPKRLARNVNLVSLPFHRFCLTIIY